MIDIIRQVPNEQLGILGGFLELAALVVFPKGIITLPSISNNLQEPFILAFIPPIESFANIPLALVLLINNYGAIPFLLRSYDGEQRREMGLGVLGPEGEYEGE